MFDTTQNVPQLPNFDTQTELCQVFMMLGWASMWSGAFRPSHCLQYQLFGCLSAFLHKGLIVNLTQTGV